MTRALVIATALALLLAGGAAGRTTTWTFVPSPKVAEGELAAVSADSETDVWAVGNKFDVQSERYKALIEHFDGTAWHVVKSLNPLHDTWLNGVAALAPNDVWAVGFTTNTDWGSNKTVVEHWDGTSWSIVPSPNPSSGANDLWSVAALAPNDVWAAGEITGSFGMQTLIEHWDGTKWRVVHSPNRGSFDFFHRIAADAAGGAWAAGASYDESGDGREVPLVARWNGSKWSLVQAEAVRDDDYIRGVAAASGADAWFVGEADDPAPGYEAHPLVEHWDGSRWSSVDSPPGSYLAGVVALSSSDAWIVGDDADKTLVQHWDGAGWSTVPSPNGNDSPYSLNSLNAVARVPGTRTLWAVGSFNDDDRTTRPLILQATNA